MSTFKRSRFSVQKQNLLRRPSLTDEQNRVWNLVEKTGTPQGAANDLVSRLLQLEAQVEAWEQAEAAAAADEPETDSETAAEPKPEQA